MNVHEFFLLYQSGTYLLMAWQKNHEPFWKPPLNQHDFDVLPKATVPSGIKLGPRTGTAETDRWLGPSWAGSNFWATVVGWVGFNDTVTGWVRRRREMRTTCKTAFYTTNSKLVKKSWSESLHLKIFRLLLWLEQFSKRWKYAIILGSKFITKQLITYIRLLRHPE